MEEQLGGPGGWSREPGREGGGEGRERTGRPCKASRAKGRTCPREVGALEVAPKRPLGAAARRTDQGCEGGRLGTREDGTGPGGRRRGRTGWRQRGGKRGQIQDKFCGQRTCLWIGCRGRKSSGRDNIEVLGATRERMRLPSAERSRCGGAEWGPGAAPA